MGCVVIQSVRCWLRAGNTCHLVSRFHATGMLLFHELPRKGPIGAKSAISVEVGKGGKGEYLCKDTLSLGAIKLAMVVGTNRLAGPWVSYRMLSFLLCDDACVPAQARAVRFLCPRHVQIFLLPFSF